MASFSILFLSVYLCSIYAKSHPSAYAGLDGNARRRLTGQLQLILASTARAFLSYLWIPLSSAYRSDGCRVLDKLYEPQLYIGDVMPPVALDGSRYTERRQASYLSHQLVLPKLHDYEGEASAPHDKQSKAGTLYLRVQFLALLESMAHARSDNISSSPCVE